MKKYIILFLIGTILQNCLSYDYNNPYEVGVLPSVPMLSSPVRDTTSNTLTYTLNWNTSSGSTYILQVSTNITFSSYVYNQSGLAGTSQQITGLSDLTTYYWRVSATNNYGISGWSSIGSFTTTGTAPRIPTLTLPENGSGQSVILTLSWNTSSGATSYNLQVATDNLFSNTGLIVNMNVVNNTSYKLSNLNSLTTYYWKVAAVNSYGTSAWSNIWSFTTSGTIPSIPTLLLPINGSTDQSITPALRWNTSNGVTSYSLQVSTSNTFSSFVYNQNGLTGTTQQITGLSNLTTYYWRVNAANNYGTSNWSNIWSFTTIRGTSNYCSGIPIVTYAGRTYNTIQIGSQCWLQENLNVGTMLQESQDQTNNGVIEKYCYNNDPNNCTIYGGLYKWAEAVQYQNGATNITSPLPAFSGNVQGICPNGWHIPTQVEFQTLETAANNDGNALKAIGQGSGSGVGTNISGFSALLAGYSNYGGNFYDLSNNTSYWSSTESNPYDAYHMYLYYNDSNIYLDYSNKGLGFSVRCCKD